MKYELFEVLVNAGVSTDCGHYYSYVKSAGGSWYCMDDSSVSSASFSGSVLNEKPYILFYKSVQQNNPNKPKNNLNNINNNNLNNINNNFNTKKNKNKIL